MRGLIKFIFAISVLLITAGCSEQKRIERLQGKIAVEAVENISGSLSDGWVVTLRIRNNTGYSPTISRADADIYCDNTLTVHAELTSEIKIPKNKICIVDIPLNIKINNPIKAFSLLLRLKDKRFDGTEIAFSADCEIMGIKRTIGTKRVATTTLFEKLGYTNKL